MATITIQFDPAVPSDVQHAFNAVYAYMKGDVAEVSEERQVAQAADAAEATAEEQEARRQEQEEADAELAAREEAEAKKAAAAAKRKEAAAKKKAEEEAAAAAAEEEEDDSGLDEEPSGPTREEVRKALKEYSAIEGKEAAIQILKDNGASSMSELSEDKFEAVLKAVN